VDVWLKEGYRKVQEVTGDGGRIEIQESVLPSHPTSLFPFLCLNRKKEITTGSVYLALRSQLWIHKKYEQFEKQEMQLDNI
jgi:hypothetical protein